jgi:hypothetical protein
MAGLISPVNALLRDHPAPTATAEELTAFYRLQVHERRDTATDTRSPPSARPAATAFAATLE